MPAAKAGVAAAQLQLADMYDLGQGVPRDFVAALGRALNRYLESDSASGFREG